MVKKRKILKKLIKEVDTKEITVITGMRQVGKTTLLKYLYEKVTSPNKIFLDIEELQNRKLFEVDNYDSILQSLRLQGLDLGQKIYMFLDEIQYVPNIASVIKYLYDHNDIKFVVTGSSSFYLKNHFTESMSGRKLIFEVYPLTFDEFLDFKNVKKRNLGSYAEKAKSKTKFLADEFSSLYEEYMLYGGFPGVVLETEVERKEKLILDIFTSYFQKDVVSLSDFKDNKNLRDLIYLLLPRIGSKVDVSKIALTLDVSRETVYNYLEFLESTYFVQSLSKYTNTDRSLSGGKKYYFCDTGMARVLGNLSSGQLLENSIFQSLRPNHELQYYQSTSGKEVDFVVDKKIGLEVKQTTSLSDVVNMKRRLSSTDLRAGYIVSPNYVDFEEVIMPWDL